MVLATTDGVFDFAVVLVSFDEVSVIEVVVVGILVKVVVGFVIVDV